MARQGATPLARRRREANTGTSVSAQIADVLAAHGLNRTAIAGVIGNAFAESSLDPAATGYGGGGLWGFTSHPNSLADLQSYAADRHAQWTSPSLQTEFLLQHVSGSLIRKLNAAPSPEAAASIFMSDFERPGIPRQGVRESAARRAFGQLGKLSSRKPRESASTSSSPSPSFSSPGGFSGELMHIGLVAALVLGGVAMIGLGTTRMLGTAKASA